MYNFKKQTSFTLSLAILISLGIIFVPPSFAQQVLICPTPVQTDSVQLIPCYVRELPAPSTALKAEPTPLPELTLELPLGDVSPEGGQEPAEEPMEEEPMEEEPMEEEPMEEEPMEEEPMEEEPMEEEPMEEEPMEEEPMEEEPQSPNEEEDCEEGGDTMEEDMGEDMP